MAILPVGIGPQEGGYQIERSLRFNSADSAYLNRTPGSSGNRQKFTIAGWLKLGRTVESGQTDYGNVINAYASGDDNGYTVLEFHQNTLRFRGWNTTWRQTTQVFRDASAWYFVLVSVDTTQATAANRIKMYVNGAEITAFSTNNNPSQNANLAFNSTGAHRIGQDNGASSSRKYDGYMAEFRLIDGSALDPTSFGEYNTDTGVWQPKAYTGSYGTNGFYLDFADNSSTTALGYDAAGSNDWTPNNFSVTAGAGNDSLVDTPTNYGTDTGVGGEVRGNYATLNPLAKAANATLSNGNLDYTNNSSTPCACPATIAVNSGKWYWEVTTSGNGFEHGLGLAEANWPTGSYTSQNFARYVTFDGTKRIGTASRTSYDASGACTAGTVLGFAADLDNGTLVVYRNGTSKGTLHSWTPSGTYYVPHADYATTASGTEVYNFGQRPFAYTAPSGFKALCTQNLPEPTVVDGGDYFNTVLYTGNGSTQSITGVGFQPDWVWAKRRNTAANHAIVDSVRGVTKMLSSSLTDAEITTTDAVTSLDSDGFTLGANTSGYGVNVNTSTYVAWNWKAGGTGVSNTAGTINSTVSANTTAGFSIVTYTGNNTANQTVGHGIGGGVAPSMIIVKNRTSGATSWAVYHASVGVGKYLELNKTDTPTTNSAFFDQVTSTVFGFDAGGSFINASGDNYVAYCFAPVAGYSAFGSYVGNADTTGSGGPFIYLGFRPKWWMHKRTDASGDGWWVYDSVRNTYNPLNLLLLPNSSSAEITQTGTGIPMDFVSNGVKIRNTSTDGSINGNGATYIYAAFAENPFKYSLAR